MAPKGSALTNFMSGSEEDGTPQIIDISEEMQQEDTKQEEEKGFLYSATEFLIISISGCAPKRQKR